MYIAFCNFYDLTFIIKSNKIKILPLAHYLINLYKKVSYEGIFKSSWRFICGRDLCRGRYTEIARQVIKEEARSE